MRRTHFDGGVRANDVLLNLTFIRDYSSKYGIRLFNFFLCNTRINNLGMLHPKSSIFRSEPGITHLSLTEDGYLLSSGGDGTIRRSAVHHLL